MYSNEIDNFLRTRNWKITPDEYSELTPQRNPQINRMTYNTSTNKVYICTNDGYEWEFEIIKD